jgi:hypothetical protein
MGIESKWGKCAIIGLIHTFQFSTFVLFVILLYWFFAFEALKSNVKLNLVHP